MNASELAELAGIKDKLPKQLYPLLDELRELLPEELYPEFFSLLVQRDGAAALSIKLQRTLSPEQISEGTHAHRIWELTGLFYLQQGRLHEALPIFSTMYDQMMVGQQESGERRHKGTPLCWISDCYARMGFEVLAKRYLMLTLCEDGLTSQGTIKPDNTGVYFRLVWQRGFSDSEVQRYAKRASEFGKKNDTNCRFPEWVLQQFDKEWMTEFPAPQEASIYSANRRYIRYLISKLGDPIGKTLELLADYLLSCMPGCRTTRRQRSKSTDYDIVCSVEGLEADFRSEFGRYFICECKDWEPPADITSFAKFCRVLDSIKSHFGILFSKAGISGQGKTEDAEREQLKVFQDRGMVIVVVDLNDIEQIANGGNFTNLLRTKYEKVRLDLEDS